MGHRLTFHIGGCQNLHGHNYEMKVSVETKKLEDNMVVDFNDIKMIFKHNVHDIFDHCFVVYKDDDIMTSFFKLQRNLKHVIVPFETTAENLAKYFFDIFAKEISDITDNRCKVTRVKVYETPTSEAVYYGEQ